jgi:tetratricopeptide (TPR) repeat protein
MQVMSVFSASEDGALKNAMVLYSEGKYQSTITELTDVEEKFKDKMDRQRLGLISYWRGICHNRLQNFSEAIKNFDRALGYEYSPQDIHYEYGQALYASEKLAEARIQFKESLKKKFKRGVSLYYIGFLSKELGEANKAYTFFRAVEKLGEEEKADVLQASQMQLGDLYLEQAEKGAEAFKMVESVVIPQYEKARDLNPESPLGSMLSDKIQKLHAFAEKYGKTNNLPVKDIKALKMFFIDCLEKLKLQKAKDVVYDKEAREISSIPSLHFNVTSKSFTLKIMDAKRVSTLKSLTPKRTISKNKLDDSLNDV